jgi:hypothetical protein
VFLAGYLSALIVRRWRTRRARRFWRPFTGKPTVVALSIFMDEFRNWERSGLVGAGDVRALLALQRKWASLGGAEFRTESSERLASQGDLRENLICIGGPDANPVTRLILDRTSTTLGVANGSVTFFDTETGRYFSPRIDTNGDRRDYGIIVRARNPFNLERAALVLAGSFGDGTRAAAELVCEERIERSDFAAARMTFELLLEVEVISGTPQTPRIVVARGLDPASRIA